MKSNVTPLFQDSDTGFTPIPWERTAMEWRGLLASPFCDLTPTQKHVLTVMCRYGKKWGEDIYPSQRAIADRAGVCKTTANNTVRIAESQGWIIRHFSSSGRGYKRTTYQLAIPTGLADVTTYLKQKFWLPSYEYNLVRNEDRFTLVKRE